MSHISTLEAAVLMVDGVDFAGKCCVEAMVVCAVGTKVPVGLRHGCEQIFVYSACAVCNAPPSTCTVPSWPDRIVGLSRIAPAAQPNKEAS